MMEACVKYRNRDTEYLGEFSALQRGGSDWGSVGVYEGIPNQPAFLSSYIAVVSNCS